MKLSIPNFYSISFRRPDDALSGQKLNERRERENNLPLDEPVPVIRLGGLVKTQNHRKTTPQQAALVANASAVEKGRNRLRKKRQPPARQQPEGQPRRTVAVDEAPQRYAPQVDESERGSSPAPTSLVERDRTSRLTENRIDWLCVKLGPWVQDPTCKATEIDSRLAALDWVCETIRASKISFSSREGGRSFALILHNHISLPENLQLALMEADIPALPDQPVSTERPARTMPTPPTAPTASTPPVITQHATTVDAPPADLSALPRSGENRSEVSRSRPVGATVHALGVEDSKLEPTQEYSKSLRRWLDQNDTDDAKGNDSAAAGKTIRAGLDSGDLSHFDLHKLTKLETLPPLPEGTRMITVPHDELIGESLQRSIAAQEEMSPAMMVFRAGFLPRSTGLSTDAAGASGASRAPGTSSHSHMSGKPNRITARPVATLAQMPKAIQRYEAELDKWLAGLVLGQSNPPNKEAIKKELMRQVWESIQPNTFDLSKLRGDLPSLPPIPAHVKEVRIRESQYRRREKEQLQQSGMEISWQISSGDSDSPTVKLGPMSHAQAQPTVGGSRPELTAKDLLSEESSSAVPAENSSDFRGTLEERLKAWVALIPKEIDAREQASKKILKWNARRLTTASDTQSKGLGMGEEPLDLSSDGHLKFSAIPPLPMEVKELIVTNQALKEVTIGDFPANLRRLDLSGNPLKNIDDSNLSESLKLLQVTLGTTTLPPRIVRELNIEGRLPSYVVNLPQTKTGRVKLDTYSEKWAAIRPTLLAWIEEGKQDKIGRRTAVQRLEEWVHGDNNETSVTPLDFANLDLEQLPPVWPYGEKIEFINARNNKLKDLPFSNIPPSLSFIDLRNNLISTMLPELTREQIAARGKVKSIPNDPRTLALQMEALGFPLNDPYVIDPRERASLAVILTGNLIDAETAEQYESRKFGPAYVISYKALDAFIEDAFRTDSPESIFFRAS